MSEDAAVSIRKNGDYIHLIGYSVPATPQRIAGTNLTSLFSKLCTAIRAAIDRTIRIIAVMNNPAAALSGPPPMKYLNGYNGLWKICRNGHGLRHSRGSFTLST